MGDIVLTNKCNLKCSYCFANEIKNSETSEFDIINFKKAVDFIKTGKNERLGIVGGEPTIHPNFREFIELLNNDNQIFNYILFTNGIEIAKYIDVLKSDKVNILINCNSPEITGNLYNKLEDSIRVLAKEKKDKLALGTNIYSADMDYSYIFDLLKLAKSNILRFSVSISNADKINSKNGLECYEKYIPILHNFYKDCLKNEIIPQFDCNGIPYCLINTEMKKTLLRINNLQKKYNIHDKIMPEPCTPMVNILPDLTAVRSICYPYLKSVNISDFESIDVLKGYFYKEIDSNFNSLFLTEDCKTCNSRREGRCFVCPTFTINEFLKLKK